MFGEQIAECVYGWGQVLRLYPNHVDIHGNTYALSELINFKPVYRRVMGVPSMRLELQFSSGAVTIRGIADIPMALKFIAYLNKWSAVTVTFSVEEINELQAAKALRALPPPQLLHERTPRPLVLSDATQERFWEYDANDQPTTVVGPFDASVVHTDPQGTDTLFRGHATETSQTLDAVPSWPWTGARHLEHKQRLKRLQVEREMRFHGFDIEALAQQLHTQPLPHLVVPTRLLAGEVAHYCSAARISDEPPDETRRGKTRVKDHGTLILTNLRIIYLGQKRQIVLGHERVLQASHVPGAIVLATEYWTRQQFFVMSRPLECAMYLEYILQHFQNTVPPICLQVQDYPTYTQSLLRSQRTPWKVSQS